MFATGPGLKSLLVLQFWASYSSQWAGIFIITLLISSVCSTKWTLVLWVSPYMRVLCTLFPPLLLQWRNITSYSEWCKVCHFCKHPAHLQVIPTLWNSNAHAKMRANPPWSVSKTPAESYQLSNMEMTFLDFQRSNLPCHIGSVSVYQIRKLLESGRIFYINNYIWNCLVNNLLTLVLQHDFVMLLLIL